MTERGRVERLADLSAKRRGSSVTAISHPVSSRRRSAEAGLIFLVALVAGVTIAASTSLANRFTWNLTPSLPRGLYAVRRGATPARGDVVRFEIPATVSELVSSRHYLPRAARLLKRIVAVAGDHVCLDGHTYAVNGRVLATVRPSDSLGRPLPLYRFCGAVLPGEVYVATPASLSFDSRYFGPLRLSALTKVNALWTY